jgi:ABC-2 type transport system permease protein
MPVVRALPPGLAGTATTHAFAGRAAGTASAAALLGAYIVAFGFFLRVRLKAQYRGEDLSEAEAPKPAARLTADEVSGAGAARWAAWLPPAVGAIAEKELRYMLRNMPVIMNLVIPFFLIIFLGLTFDSPRSKSDMDFFRQSPELLFPSAVAYSLLVLSHFANNVFAFDSRGIQMLIVAPVRFRDVLLAKNLMLGLVILLEALGVYVLVSALMGAQNPIVAVVTFAALPFILLSQFVVGNLLSLHYPRRFDFGQFRQRQSGISVLLGLLTQIVVMGIVGAIFVTARFFDRLWIAGVAYVLLGAAMLQVYVLALEHAERLAASRRETLVGELCHD